MKNKVSHIAALYYGLGNAFPMLGLEPVSTLSYGQRVGRSTSTGVTGATGVTGITGAAGVTGTTGATGPDFASEGFFAFLAICPQQQVLTRLFLCSKHPPQNHTG